MVNPQVAYRSLVNQKLNLDLDKSNMPGIIKITDAKNTASYMPVAIAEETLSAEPPKRRSYKKFAIISGSCILGAAIILAAILVGMYFFTEAQKDIIKFSYNRDSSTMEDVISDTNTNIVQYHVNSPDYEMWILDDFNHDIQVMKIHSDSGTNCYVAPLNRTIATDPTKVSAPTKQVNATHTVTYRAADTTIPDSSFLSKAAKELCKGISTYWVYPSCAVRNDSSNVRRRKREFLFDSCCCGYRVSFLTIKLCIC